jgi:hypothetical protein
MRSTILGCIIAATIAMTIVGCQGLLNCVDGKGEGTSQKRELSSFQGITIKGSMDVVVRQGSTQEVRVVAEDNIVPLITTSIENNVLIIDNNKCFNSHVGAKVYVTIPTITSLQINGSGSFTGESEINGESLRLGIEGSGNINLNVAEANLVAMIDGSGDITLKGTARQATFDVGGSGNIMASELSADACTATISGSGDCYLNVAKSLRATISGSGDIVYSGPVTDVTSKVSGSGDIRRHP